MSRSLTLHHFLENVQKLSFLHCGHHGQSDKMELKFPVKFYFKSTLCLNNAKGTDSGQNIPVEDYVKQKTIWFCRFGF